MARLEAVAAGTVADGDRSGLILKEDAVLGAALGQGQVGAPAIEAAVEVAPPVASEFAGRGAEAGLGHGV